MGKKQVLNLLLLALLLARSCDWLKDYCTSYCPPQNIMQTKIMPYKIAQYSPLTSSNKSWSACHLGIFLSSTYLKISGRTWAIWQTTRHGLSVRAHAAFSSKFGRRVVTLAHAFSLARAALDWTEAPHVPWAPVPMNCKSREKLSTIKQKPAMTVEIPGC